jgi:hypothetical protein
MPTMPATSPSGEAAIRMIAIKQPGRDARTKSAPRPDRRK